MSTQSLSIFRYADIVAEHASGTGTTTLPEHLSSPPVFSGVRVT
jgi:hypothetical protein